MTRPTSGCRAAAQYAKEPSRPWRTANLAHVRKFCDLGLYSVTFNNDLDHDYATVEAYREFREDAVKTKFRHFLEVFNPNAPQNLDPKVMPFYVNDMIMRVLAGMAKAERPLFLKMPFNGRKAMEELASHDPGLVIGILGGSAGTTRDCFELLSQGEKSGARVALFGRKINLAESPLDLVALFRPVIESQVTAEEAVRSYHAMLAKKGLKPKRALKDDLHDHRARARRLPEMTRRGIVLAGIVVLDVVHIIDHWPAEETLAFIDRTEFAAGRAAAQCGRRPAETWCGFSRDVARHGGRRRLWRDDAGERPKLWPRHVAGDGDPRRHHQPHPCHVLPGYGAAHLLRAARLQQPDDGGAPAAAGGQHRQALLPRQPRHGARTGRERTAGACC